jgi:hypothetical protein
VDANRLVSEEWLGLNQSLGGKGIVKVISAIETLLPGIKVCRGSDYNLIISW